MRSYFSFSLSLFISLCRGTSIQRTGEIFKSSPKSRMHSFGRTSFWAFVCEGILNSSSFLQSPCELIVALSIPPFELIIEHRYRFIDAGSISFFPFRSSVQLTANSCNIFQVQVQKSKYKFFLFFVSFFVFVLHVSDEQMSSKFEIHLILNCVGNRDAFGWLECGFCGHFDLIEYENRIKFELVSIEFHVSVFLVIKKKGGCRDIR